MHVRGIHYGQNVLSDRTPQSRFLVAKIAYDPQTPQLHPGAPRIASARIPLWCFPVLFLIFTSPKHCYNSLSQLDLESRKEDDNSMCKWVNAVRGRATKHMKTLQRALCPCDIRAGPPSSSLASPRPSPSSTPPSMSTVLLGRRRWPRQMTATSTSHDDLGSNHWYEQSLHRHIDPLQPYSDASSITPSGRRSAHVQSGLRSWSELAVAHDEEGKVDNDDEGTSLHRRIRREKCWEGTSSSALYDTTEGIEDLVMAGSTMPNERRMQIRLGSTSYSELIVIRDEGGKSAVGRFEGRQRVALYSEHAVMHDAEEGGMLEDGRVEFKSGRCCIWLPCEGRTDGGGQRAVDGDDDVHGSFGTKVASGKATKSQRWRRCSNGHGPCPSVAGKRRPTSTRTCDAEPADFPPIPLSSLSYPISASVTELPTALDFCTNPPPANYPFIDRNLRCNLLDVQIQSSCTNAARLPMMIW
ncbi:hypothetical protein CPC08DRAFT_779909 [Agrocybe pediades]|nr:hypothetical protein CPC08DRAFT_779909 [Agrocybe pediades]